MCINLPPTDVLTKPCYNCEKTHSIGIDVSCFANNFEKLNAYRKVREILLIETKYCIDKNS